MLPRLPAAQSDVPSGFRIGWAEGHRNVDLRERYFTDYRRELLDLDPALDNKASYRSPVDSSLHVLSPRTCSGAAIDLTLCDENCNELDMGTRVNASPEESDGACYFDAPVSSEARAHATFSPVHPSVEALVRTSAIIARLAAVALKPALAMLLARGHDDLAVAKQSLAVHYRAYAEQDGGRAMARQVDSLDVTDTLRVADGIPGLDVPARVVWGAADHFQKVEYGERFARDLGVPLHRIDGGEHFTAEDHPDEVAGQLRSLAAEVEAGHCGW